MTYPDLHLTDGRWERHTATPELELGESVVEHLEAHGWVPFLRVGDVDGEACLLTWQCVVEPVRYLVQVTCPTAASPLLAVDTLPELMDLLARWAPVVQAATIAALTQRADEPWLPPTPD